MLCSASKCGVLPLPFLERAWQTPSRACQTARSHRLVCPAGVAPARERQPGLEKIKVDWVPTVQFKRSPSPILQGPLASAGSDGQVSP